MESILDRLAVWALEFYNRPENDVVVSYLYSSILSVGSSL